MELCYGLALRTTPEPSTQIFDLFGCNTVPRVAVNGSRRSLKTVIQSSVTRKTCYATGHVSEVVLFDWDVNNQYEKLLSGFKDNIYELRLKNFCFGTETRPISALADSTVHEYVSDQILTLRVDTKTPIPGKTYPAFQRFYTVEFPEAIDCSNQKVAITKKRTSCGDDGRSLNQAVSEEAIKAGFDFQCSNNEVGFKWMIGFPNTEVGQYAVEVSGVRDEAGNDACRFHVCHGRELRAGFSKDVARALQPGRDATVR